MSKSPRSTEASIDWKDTCTEEGGAAESAGDRRGDFDVESAHLRGIARVGLDERRAAFGVAAPDEGRRGLGEGRQARGQSEPHPGQGGQGAEALQSGGPTATGPAGRGRRKIQNVRSPVTKPPTWAQNAMPPTACCDAIAATPLKNCITNQRPM